MKANGLVAKQVQRVCHDTLPWFMSFSLEAARTRCSLWAHNT